jgi:hypothetical protein
MKKFFVFVLFTRVRKLFIIIYECEHAFTTKIDFMTGRQFKLK